jgi:AraC-like DNA-binding protein
MPPARRSKEDGAARMESQSSLEGDRTFGACPDVGMIQTGYLRGFKTFVRQLGGSYESLFERHQIDCRAFEESDYHVGSHTVVALLDECSAMFDDAYFGLRLAEQQDPEIFGCITALARSAPDLRTALQCFLDYIPVLNSPEGELELRIGAQVTELRWRSDSDLNEQANHHGLLLFVKTLRMLCGKDFRPSYATLQSRPAGRAWDGVETRVGCRIRKGEANGVAFPTDMLAQPIPSRDRMVYGVLRSHVEALKNARSPDFSSRVEGFIRDALPSGRCGIEQCAARMRIPLRTLQRRLAEEGRSFSALLEKQRMELARQVLRQGEDSLAHVAFSLGYFDQTSFCRAFKRWTGVSPRAYRAGWTPGV